MALRAYVTDALAHAMSAGANQRQIWHAWPFERLLAGIVAKTSQMERLRLPSRQEVTADQRVRSLVGCPRVNA